MNQKKIHFLEGNFSSNWCCSIPLTFLDMFLSRQERFLKILWVSDWSVIFFLMWDNDIWLYWWGENFPSYHFKLVLNLNSALRHRFMDIIFLMYLPVFCIPQFIYRPFHSILSNHDLYPYLNHVAPKDTYLAFAMVSLKLHFSQAWVGMVTLNDEQNVQFLSEIR